MSDKTISTLVCTISTFILLSLPLSLNAARIDRYVDKDSTAPEHPYDSWANAATDIQSAIDAADAGQGDEVIVRAGIYDEGGRLSGWSSGTYGTALLTNRVVLAKGITLRSENNDPTNTIIKGYWHPGTTNGASAIRCIYISSSNARLIGFTLTNGATLNLA